MMQCMLIVGYYLLLQILYTGDFSRQEDRHLMAAEVPTVTPDVLICVCVLHKPL